MLGGMSVVGITHIDGEIAGKLAGTQTLEFFSVLKVTIMLLVLA